MGKVLKSVGGTHLRYNLFVQPDEPATKDGLWIKAKAPMKIDDISCMYIDSNTFKIDNSFTIPSADFTHTGKIAMRHNDPAGKDSVYFFKDANYSSYPLQKYSFSDNTVANITNSTPADLVSSQIKASIYYANKMFFFNTTASYSFDFSTETFANLNFVVGNNYITYGYAEANGYLYMFNTSGICYKYNLNTSTLTQFSTGLTTPGYRQIVFSCDTDIYIIYLINPSSDTTEWTGYVLDTNTDTLIQLTMSDPVFYKSSTTGCDFIGLCPLMDKLGVITSVSSSGYTIFQTMFNKRDFTKNVYTKESSAYTINTNAASSLYSPFLNGMVLPNYSYSDYFCGNRTDTHYFGNENLVGHITRYFYDGSIYLFGENCSTQHPIRINTGVTKESGKNKLVILDGGVTPVQLVKKGGLPFLIGGCLLYTGDNQIVIPDMYIGDGTKWVRFFDDFPLLQKARDYYNS